MGLKKKYSVGVFDPYSHSLKKFCWCFGSLLTFVFKTMSLGEKR